MNQPDQLAWKFFVEVNAPTAGGHALFETWANDTDTFTAQPRFPANASPLRLHPPVVSVDGHNPCLRTGANSTPFAPSPGEDKVSEEARRNRVAFDFIVSHDLNRVSGLRAAFGKTLAFPQDTIEIKASWVAVSDIPSFTSHRVSAAEVGKLYHTNTDSTGKLYALVGMHVISRLVPNWTWATFEHEDNPERCDSIGCRDSYGALTASVAPNGSAGQGYPACAKTPALLDLLKNSDVDPAYAHYCLKGSQTDTVDGSGLAVRLGNSAIEEGFVARSSCMSCHGRAGFDASGHPLSLAGCDANGAPLGPIDPAWFWSTGGRPAWQGVAGLLRIATPTDFDWSIPFCAYDDTAKPAQTATVSCAGR